VPHAPRLVRVARRSAGALDAPRERDEIETPPNRSVDIALLGAPARLDDGEASDAAERKEAARAILGTRFELVALESRSCKRSIESGGERSPLRDESLELLLIDSITLDRSREEVRISGRVVANQAPLDLDQVTESVPR
jgi:hypothetical protein